MRAPPATVWQCVRFGSWNIRKKAIKFLPDLINWTADNGLTVLGLQEIRRWTAKTYGRYTLRTHRDSDCGILVDRRLEPGIVGECWDIGFYALLVQDTLFLSGHLPHARSGRPVNQGQEDSFLKLLQDIEALVLKWKSSRPNGRLTCLVAIDANIGLPPDMGAATGSHAADRGGAGQGIPRTQAWRELLLRQIWRATNTFPAESNLTSALLQAVGPTALPPVLVDNMTWRQGTYEGQIDFVLASACWTGSSTTITSGLPFSTDHWPIVGTFHRAQPLWSSQSRSFLATGWEPDGLAAAQDYRRSLLTRLNSGLQENNNLDTSIAALEKLIVSQASRVKHTTMAIRRWQARHAPAPEVVAAKRRMSRFAAGTQPMYKLAV